MNDLFRLKPPAYLLELRVQGLLITKGASLFAIRLCLARHCIRGA